MYAQFEYLRPLSLEEIPTAGEGDAFYGGGTDLLVLLREGKVQAKRLIDIKSIPSLREISETPDHILIGCGVTLSEIRRHPLVRRWVPALAEAAGRIGCTQIQNKATLAGNIQTASPAGDGLNAAWALGGVVVLSSRVGVERLPLEDFILGPRKTALCPGQLIVAVEFPKRQWSYQRFFKVGRRNALAISVVNGAVAVSVEAGRVKDLCISVGAVGPTPLRMREAEDALRGTSLDMTSILQATAMVQTNVMPISDLRASGEYRAYMAGVMVKRQLIACREEWS